jgi:HK97 family phage major capsid protein
MEIKDLVDKLNASTDGILKSQEKAAAEVKELGEASAETKNLLAKQIEAQKELKELFEKMDNALKDMQLKAKKYDEQTPQLKSLGQTFVESKSYLDASANGARNVQPVDMDKKAITSLAASAGVLIRPDRDPTVYQNPNRPIRIRDLIPTVPTSSNAVEFMRENVFTNNAGPQGTVAGLGASEFVAKNESNITYELVTKPVRTIAHWIPASRQVLSDAPMLQGLINQRLVYGLDLKSDQQLLLGDGTGQELDGLLVDGDINDILRLPAGTTAAQKPGAMIDHIRKAKTACQLQEYYNMTGLVLNPTDWELLETAKATDGHYLMVSMPTTTAVETVWRIPVIVTNAMPVNTFLIGDWSMGATIYDREDISVRVSESHADYFIKNGVAILGEERYTLAIPLPKAFCKGSFLVTGA